MGEFVEPGESVIAGKCPRVGESHDGDNRDGR
jgi:hypothetical protein